jgi:hypothetical protein
VVSVSERPSRLRLAMWKTHNTRAKVRVLPPRYDL